MRALWISLLVIGCGTKEPAATSSSPAPAPETKPAEAKPPEPKPAAGNDCADRAAKLDKRLHELAAATPGFMPIVRGIAAPTSPSAKVFDQRGFVVAVAKDGTTFVQGEKYAKAKDLGDYLNQMSMTAQEKYVMAAGSSKDFKLALYIWADKDTPAATVASVLAVANSKSDHWLPRLVVAGTASAPADPALASKLPPSEPDATKALAAQVRTAIGECKQIIMPLATSTMEGLPQKQTEKLAKEVPAGLAECACKIPDVDAFEQGMQLWFGAWAPPLAWVDMPKVGKDDKQPISKLVAK